MSGNKLNIEELFRSQFDNYIVNPSPGLWSGIRTRIMWRQFFSFSFNTFNVYYLAAVLAVATGGMLFFASPASNGPEAANNPVSRQSPLPAEQSPDMPKAVTGPDIVNSGNPGESESPAEAQPKETALPDRMLSVPEQEGADREPSNKRKSQSPEGKEPVAESKDAPPARIGFSASRQSGCAPLAVEFHNESENAEKFLWTFGDGGSSTEANPSYVFDESGDHTVILRMTGKDGLEYMKQGTIRVFETPKALFEFEEYPALADGHPVYFYNYSKSADFYEWDFGDQQKSGLSDPVHYYDQSGNYHVKLKVWNENQCFDSLIIYNAFSSQANDIVFPNAFTPNLNGPCDGYYEENDIGNTVFHPVVTGELIEYQLRIFNRFGIQIFESNELRIGWDGYYRQQLASQGVYIWKARGKFSNGQTFVQSGDVTLIKKY